MPRILFGLVALALAVIPAQAADIYGYGSYGGAPYQSGHHRLPVCDEPGVISKVVEKFTYYDTHVIGSGLAVANIGDIRETRMDVDGPSLVPRRYCDAIAYLSDGRRSEVVYLIEFQGGFASIHWNVQSCLPGFDPYRVYGAWCHSIRP